MNANKPPLKLTAKKPVTVIVPVYADWDSLNQCIESLKRYLPSHHKVLIVNDCGPDADLLEKSIRKSIKSADNFSYHRNAENLGFVGTCNRAVFELDETDNDILLLNSDTIVTKGFLDEMLAVLYQIDRHGAVVPRSNNATLASVPLRQLFPRQRDDLDYAYSTYLAIKDLLPRFNVVPVAPGFCLLIRRKLIRNFGLFDEVFGRGYNEENDFCLRINKYGYSSVMSNHAFVYHLESRSFSADLKLKLNEKNGGILLKRYPFYPLIIDHYFNQYMDPIDNFADAIANTAKKKVLINLYHFPLAYNGTTKNGLSFLKYLRALSLDPTQYDVTVLCQEASAEFHKLEQFGFRLVYPHTIKDEIFHIAYCPSQFFHPENLILMNRHALRITYSLLDIISLRCQYLLSNDIKQRAVFLDSLKYADRIITISNFTQRDTEAYFSDNIADFANKVVTIQQGFPGVTFEEDTGHPTGTEPQTEPYILVFGNDYFHKAIDKVLPILNSLKIHSVVLGPKSISSHMPNVSILPSGDLSDAKMQQLIADSALILFPSQYEGFGFPILEAAHYQKPLLYAATEVGEEIAQLAQTNIATDSFERFEEIPRKVEQLLRDTHPGTASPIRALDEYNQRIWEVLVDSLAVPYNDFDALKERWEYFAKMQDYYQSGGARMPLQQAIIQGGLNRLRKSPVLYHYMRTVYRSLKTAGISRGVS